MVDRNKHREAAKTRTRRNTFQIKEQNKTLDKRTNKMETSNLPDAEFKTLVIRVLNEFSENFKRIKRTSQK